MNKKKPEKFLYNQTPLRILSFLSRNPDTVFSAKEIEKVTLASKGATHQTLKRLLSLDIISRQKKGNLFLYKVNQDTPILKPFKIFETMLKIQPLIQKIKAHCYQIILFGSCADGSNTMESDIDLFIKTGEREPVEKAVNKYRRTGLHITAAIYDPIELIESKKEDKAFFEQVKKGITIWEGSPEDEEDQS